MSNSIEARTSCFIALGQIHNGTGTCRFLSIHTGEPFTANHFTVLPITDLVVEHPPVGPYINGVDLSDESSVREIKIDHTPDPTTLGTPIIFTTDETDEEDFPVPLLTSPTVQDD